LPQRDDGSAAVRHPFRTLADFDQRAGLFLAGRENAAWAVIFEAARNDPDAVGQQGRGQCVAGIAGVVAAVEGEIETLAAIDFTTAGQPERMVGAAVHCPVFPSGGSIPIGQTSRMSWVTVSLTTWNHCRQP